MQREKEKMNKRDTILYFVLITLIVVVFVLFVVHIHATWAATVNSDDASELILAKKLSDEGGVLSKTWYYSTELRVINTQLVFAPLFSLTDNWHTVRVAGATILLALLALSAVLLARALRLGRIGTALLVLAVLTPFSQQYYSFVLLHSYYIPHIVISFVTLAAVFTLPRLSEQRRRGAWLLLNAAVSLLALLAGLGGPRQVLVLYMPLLLAALAQTAAEWRLGAAVEERGRVSGWTAHLLGESALQMLFTGIGFLINSFLLKKEYAFLTWGGIRFSSFSLERLEDVLNGFLAFFGYTADRELFSLTLVQNAVSILTMLVLLVALVDTLRDPNAGREHKTMAAVFLSSVTVICILYCFSDMEYADRYSIPILVFAFPVIVSWLQRKAAGGLLRAERAAIALGLALFLAVGLANYKTLKRGGMSEQERLAQTLCEQGCRHGYATFWNANLLTELSNGELEMWIWYDRFPEYGDTSVIHQWLQSTDHMTPPEGEVFCVFSADQWEMPAVKRLEGAELLYESDIYRVYRFPTFAAIADHMAAHSGA